MAEGGGEEAGDDATAGEVVVDEAAVRCRASRSSLSCDSSKFGLAAAGGAMLLGLGEEGGALCRWTRFTARQNWGCPSTSCTHPLRVLRIMYLRPFRDSAVVALNPEASKFSSSSWLSFSLYRVRPYLSTGVGVRLSVGEPLEAKRPPTRTGVMRRLWGWLGQAWVASSEL